MSKVALITGITGQDGSYLAEFLIEKGYEVHGLLRRSSSFNTGRIEHLYLDEWVRDMKKARLVNLHWADMTDSSSLIRIIGKVRPTEIYNLAAQSHVKVSFDVPEYTAETDAVGVLRLLEAIRICGLEKECRIYQASTSELYGKVQEVPQKETTPFYPRSPYGVAKLYADYELKDKLYFNDKVLSILEDGLCAKLCIRYKLTEAKALFDDEYANGVMLLKRINNSNRPMVYSEIDGGSYMDNYYNGFSPRTW